MEKGKRRSRMPQESVPLLSRTRRAPNLALLDCESEPILCNSWMARPPNIWHILIPNPSSPPSSSSSSTTNATLRIIPLNETSTTPVEILEIHSKDKYKEYQPYAGVFHPFNGMVHKLGLAVPIGWVLYGFGLVPSWTIMIALSFFSRQMM